MPRTARIDIDGGLYHVIARGIERRPIVHDDQDRVDFLRRVQHVSGEEDITVFGFALMENHLHLVLRRGVHPLSRFMRRLLTGHATRFNRRHERVGHLFQNRYKSLLCGTDAYLFTLIRYVHLNPVRAGLVSDPIQYRWTSHHDYLGARRYPWVETSTVLAMLGGQSGYLALMGDGPDVARLDGPEPGDRGGESTFWLEGQVIGNRRFAERMACLAKRCRTRDDVMPDPGLTLEQLAARVANEIGITPDLLRSRLRSRLISRARRVLIGEAVLGHGLRPIDLSRYLGLTTAAITLHLRAITRGGRSLVA